MSQACPDIGRAYPTDTVASDPSNLEIAAAFDELADLYELDGAIVHRINAYRSAAKARATRRCPSRR